MIKGLRKYNIVFTEKEHQRQLERVRKEQRKAERGELRTEQAQQEENDSINENKDSQQQPEQPSAVAAMHSEGLVRAAHSMTHDISHSEPVGTKAVQNFISTTRNHKYLYSLRHVGLLCKKGDLSQGDSICLFHTGVRWNRTHGCSGGRCSGIQKAQCKKPSQSGTCHSKCLIIK